MNDDKPIEETGAVENDDPILFEIIYRGGARDTYKAPRWIFDSLMNAWRGSGPRNGQRPVDGVEGFELRALSGPFAGRLVMARIFVDAIIAIVQSEV